MTEVAAGCPCGSARYATCCQPYHQGLPAPTAEALMRSRYSAFVLKLAPYLLASWHPSTRPLQLDLEADSTQWIGLTVKRQAPQPNNQFLVEFIARYKLNGRAYRHHEASRFIHEDGRWYYCDGDILGGSA